jgi:hypothetical protein
MTFPFVRPLSRAAAALPVVALSVLMSVRMLATDQRNGDLGSATAEKRADGLPIRTDPPKFLFSEQPAILVPIDGDPVYRAVQGTDLQRIINTKPFIVRDAAGIHYMKVFDGWMQTYILTGLWSASGAPPPGAEEALQQAVAARTVDLLDGRIPGKPDETPKLEVDAVGTIFVSTVPAELIVTSGPFQFAAVEGTSLQYVENTTANVFKEPTDDELYVLSAGRWFRSWRTDGPWQFVPSNELPADFAAIPDSSPKASVKASIAGTTQAPR